MNHPVIMQPDGPHMPMDISIPQLLSSVADMLEVAQLGDPDHPGLEKSPDQDLIIVGNVKFLIMAPYGVIKGFPPSP